MRVKELYRIVLVCITVFLPKFSFSQNGSENCPIAFTHEIEEFAVENTIRICSNENQIPYLYIAEVNMPVCDDTLCANVILKIRWDLAGNYLSFDTVPGFPLTKFDHKKFVSADYLKLDQILRNRNSMLRILNKEDLVDKSVKVKSETVDAVTSATPKTIKNSVVEGAVYTTHSLWHFINGAIKTQMAGFTMGIYSEPVSRLMLLSENHETQLFALRNWTEKDYEKNAGQLFLLIKQSVPLVRANAISRTPLPFESSENNRQFVALFPLLDNYSRSVLINRVVSDEKVAKAFLPELIHYSEYFTGNQLEQIAKARRVFEIQGCEHLH